MSSRSLARLTATTGGVALIAGVASALFLISLETVTVWREMHPRVLQLLPFAGLLIVFLYRRFGAESSQVAGPVPAAGPLILLSTLLTHAFGGSAGREGTAVQMGAAAAERLGHWTRLSEADRRLLWLAGMSAGFASVFGTPWAGTLFGLEVVGVGALHWRRLGTRLFWREIGASLPLCAFAAFAADTLTRLLLAQAGLHHTTYEVGSLPAWEFPILTMIALASLIFAAAARIFVATLLATRTGFARVSPNPYARVALGGVLVALASWLLGDAYLGLGTSRMLAAFDGPVWLGDPGAKTLLTALTLGSGFKGGEVTPLFFVGSTLGSALSAYIPLSTGLLAALGLVGVFAGAANVPWACVAMAMELFGPKIGPGAGVACLVAYFFSSHRGIYSFQIVVRRKWRPDPLCRL